MVISEHCINILLLKQDIEGFIALGAPTDAYESEAEAIADALAELTPEQSTEEQVLAIVSLVWAKYFELSPEDIQQRLAEIRQVVRQIVELSK